MIALRTHARDPRSAEQACSNADKDACAVLEPQLTEYAAGEIGGGQRTAIEAHLAQCDACRSRVAEYARLRRLSRQVGEAEQAEARAPDQLIADILARAPGGQSQSGE